MADLFCRDPTEYISVHLKGKRIPRDIQWHGGDIQTIGALKTYMRPRCSIPKFNHLIDHVDNALLRAGIKIRNNYGVTDSGTNPYSCILVFLMKMYFERDPREVQNRHILRQLEKGGGMRLTTGLRTYLRQFCATYVYEKDVDYIDRYE